jgi:hypothetical protein
LLHFAHCVHGILPAVRDRIGVAVLHRISARCAVYGFVDMSNGIAYVE